MMPSPETQPIVQRSRTLVLVAVAAMVLLALIAVMAVVAFVRLNGFRPTLAPNSGVDYAPIAAPVATEIRPWLHAPPSTWDDRVG